MGGQRGGSACRSFVRTRTPGHTYSASVIVVFDLEVMSCVRRACEGEARCMGAGERDIRWARTATGASFAVYGRSIMMDVRERHSRGALQAEGKAEVIRSSSRSLRCRSVQRKSCDEKANSEQQRGTRERWKHGNEFNGVSKIATHFFLSTVEMWRIRSTSISQSRNNDAEPPDHEPLDHHALLGGDCSCQSSRDSGLCFYNMYLCGHTEDRRGESGFGCVRDDATLVTLKRALASRISMTSRSEHQTLQRIVLSVFSASDCIGRSWSAPTQEQFRRRSIV
jgi:hypothetical protein